MPAGSRHAQAAPTTPHDPTLSPSPPHRPAAHQSHAAQVDARLRDGKTPLMMACHAGKLDCVRLLVLQVKVKLPGPKCEAGKTARMYAEARKHEKIVTFLDNPNAPPPESPLE